MATSIIRPGFMVSLKTSVQGGVAYQRTDLDASGVDATGTAAVARWETTKIVADPAEHDKAVGVRNKARSLISKVCVPTAFGLLCPEAAEGDLLAAVAEARALVREHNDSASRTTVGLYVLTGKIASTDEENARAIGEEIRGLIAGMSSAIDRLDPEGLREAASKAQKVAAMLAPEESEKVGAAVQAARKAARDITRRVIKNAEPAAMVLLDIQRGAIEQARIAFLDLDGDATVAAGEEMPAADLGRMASLEMAGEGQSDGEDEPSNGGGGGAEVSAEAVARTLAWMQEQDGPVQIVTEGGVKAGRVLDMAAGGE